MTRIDVALFNYQDGGRQRDGTYNFFPLQRAFADIDTPPALILFCEAKNYKDHAGEAKYLAAEALSDELGVPYVVEIGSMARAPMPPAVFYDPRPGERAEPADHRDRPPHRQLSGAAGRGAAANLAGVGVAGGRSTAAPLPVGRAGLAAPAGAAAQHYPHPRRPIAGGPARRAAELVGQVERGLLVTDLWYTRPLDPRTVVVTGLTRNGVWLIEDGKLTKPIRNLRFTQSYPQALAPGAVKGVGCSASVMPAELITVIPSWIRTPALHLASWNFTDGGSG